MLRPAQAIPPQYQRNFLHLYFDIGWFGVLNGSALSFLAIYAARLGASSAQIGLISAVPSVISILLALPTGAWLEKRPVGKAVFWTSILQRSFYLIFAFFPILLRFMSESTQVWVLIACIFTMSVPATALGVSFNTLFASAAPIEWRGHVAGIRNAVFALTTVVVSLVCGQILQTNPFPNGYIWVFGIGALGGLMSSVHLLFVKPIEVAPASPYQPRSNGEKSIGQSLRRKIRWDVLQGAFRRVLFFLICFHFVQYLPLPLFSIYSVNVLDLSDQVISMGTAIFSLTSFLGSTQFARISGKWGNRIITGVGLMMLGVYPVLLGLATNAVLYIAASIVGGFAWSLAGGALFNYLLEHVPADDRPAHLSWYTLGSNTAILAGSLLGPVVGEWIGLSPALFLFGALRLIIGFTIVRWG